MKFKIKKTELTDGSPVYDVDLIANANTGGAFGKSMCIFSCQSEKDAFNFYHGLKRLVEKYTTEVLTKA